MVILPKSNKCLKTGAWNENASLNIIIDIMNHQIISWKLKLKKMLHASLHTTQSSHAKNTSSFQCSDIVMCVTFWAFGKHCKGLCGTYLGLGRIRGMPQRCSLHLVISYFSCWPLLVIVFQEGDYFS